MTIRVALRHKTAYKFDRLVTLSPHSVRLRPAPHCRTPITSYSLKIQPEQHFINWQQDAFGNFLARLVFPEKARSLEIDVELIADMTVINPFDFFIEDYAEQFPFTYPQQLQTDLLPYFDTVTAGPLLTKWLQAVDKTPSVTIDFLVALNQRLQHDIDYLVRMAPGVQTPEQTLELKQGSCRDSAWLLVQILRHLGLAARFVSGYLVQLTPDQKALDGPAGPEQDFTDLHAWCEVYLPGAGWVGLDPTSGLLAGEGHIPLACSPHPVSAAPISGYTDECEVEFCFSNEVTRIHEDPRVTRPYTEHQWAQVLALGDAVDDQFSTDDVRLTMGGEPTFVSIDDMESAQWNTAALGDDKLSLAKQLLLRLREHFAPNGLLHYGQGKWYPGEELPRWALGLFWRKDAEPLWQAPELLARVDQDYGHDLGVAETFGRQLCDVLGLDQRYLQAAYEDAVHYLQQAQQLPVDLELQAANAHSDLERRRLLNLLQQGWDTAAGLVLPVEWDGVRQIWRSSLWPLRRERIVLIPGDSPLGLRLPLNDLPAEAELEHDIPVEPDPFAPQPPLLESGALQYSKTVQQAVAQQDAARSNQPVVRTALCLQARDGKLHIFMPPIKYLEQYINLLAAIEASASALNIPVIIEGYEPPRDPRLHKLLITPDPGVIEVNVHPVTSWRELVANTEALYAAARQARLTTEKFMLDGRHTGTGGGNHITLGGPTAADSPLLRRPDLLRSLISYWQHHPSLSYFFSGMFIGPTSQAPRVDEGRGEMLYELEIAFQQMPAAGLVEQPWLVDRLLRNLLIDITGNTHRAEFCIDKLYSPDSPAGRLGILELRGFEMPPHSRMALVQALLIRCLLARFWRQPYKHPLVRWGTRLHDKFMLPYFLWQDMLEVVDDLREHGYPFQAEWLAPFEEFRFPHYGRAQFGEIELELRWAIEPWHVLGEETGQLGTARYVDSSVERVQVKLTGLTDSRYVLACNGCTVPLKNTGRHGEYIAGVRYRAWQPPSALHPTVGVHTPLVFDLIDCWNGRAIGGCTYHVSHPGGRNYATFPVNAFEAESRRVNRFFTIGHTPGPVPPRPEVDALRQFFPQHYAPKDMVPPPAEGPAEYPYTLDLRKQPRLFG